MRFQTQIMILFIVLFVVTAGLLILFSMQLQQKVMDIAEKDLQNVIHSVQASTQKLNSEQMPDQKFLSNFIHDAKENNSVQEISVVSSANEVVASSNPKKVGSHRRHPLKDQLTVYREQIVEVDSMGGHHYLVVTIPIVREQKVIGLVQTSFVVNDLAEFVKKVFVKEAIIAIAALFTLFLGFYILFHNINRPISTLCKAADQVASGDSTIQLETKGTDELRRLILSFNTMAKRLNEQRSLEEKLRGMERQAILSETAAVMAHEIRNPLNLINLSVDHLIDEYQPQDPGSRNLYLELMSNVKREAQRLNRMVTEFLSLGKPAKLVKTNFNLRQLISEIEMLLKHQLIELGANLSINVPPDLQLNADMEQLRLVLMNLILNALQVTGQKCRVSLSAFAVGAEVSIKVDDNGPGIAPQDMEKIFEPYFSTRPGGTGLGLALVKRIIQKHEGQVSAGNLKGGGARFEVTLPNEEQHVENPDS